MPPLDNPRWEQFAKSVASGRTATRSYLEAGYQTNAKAASVSASRLLENPSVSARVAELSAKREALEEQGQHEAIKQVALSKAWVLERLIGNALGDNGAVANKALELLGRELGMFIERKEIGAPGEFDGLTPDELRDRLRREAEELGQGAVAAALAGGDGKTRGKPH